MGAVSTKILSMQGKSNKIKPDPNVFRGSRHNYGTIVNMKVEPQNKNTKN